MGKLATGRDYRKLPRRGLDKPKRKPAVKALRSRSVRTSRNEDYKITALEKKGRTRKGTAGIPTKTVGNELSLPGDVAGGTEVAG